MIQRQITIELPKVQEEPKPLAFGGIRPDGTEISVNSRYFEKNGKPWLPVMGEFHFSRYSKAEWEKELCKMRAGGVEIVATYIFWIHHEEEKGAWNFEGDRSLRDFIAVCKKLDFPLILRIGPWAHGECRNGGFPDWLCRDTSIQARTNDPKYLQLVHRLYGRIFQEAKGFLWSDNGPIVGIQLENEYCHCGGPNIEEGKAHMAELKRIAVEKGFVVPLYTATAWGGAAVVDGDTLPMMGGYVDAPWDQSIEELAPNANFLMQTALNDPLIGSDHKRDDSEHAFTCDINAYPYVTAELGGGMQSTEHRRVVAFPKDTAALSLCKLGSGANLLGYYMYHGGTNPDGKLSTLQESKETGYPNDLPIKSYDFEAPLGECGMAAESYGLLRRLHLMLEEWGALIAPSVTVIPPESSRNPGDYSTPRISLRHNTTENSGFVFINHHMRKRVMEEEKLNLTVGDIVLPTLQLKDGDMLALPYNLKLGEARLLSTNATPLTRIASRYFFYTDRQPVYRFEGPAAELITLSAEEAKNCYRFGDKLYISPCPLFARDGAVWAESTEARLEITVYGETGGPEVLCLQASESAASCELTEEAAESYRLRFSYNPGVHSEDFLLTLDYAGDKAEIYQEGRLIADWFTSGLPFRTALKRHGYPAELTVKLFHTEQGRYFDIPQREGCHLEAATVTPVYLLCLDS